MKVKVFHPFFLVDGVTFMGIVPSEGKPHGIVPKEKRHEKKYNNNYINTSNLWFITEVNMHWEHWENQIKM